VRAENAEAGLKRIQDKFSANGLDMSKLDCSKIEVIPGSVEDLTADSNLSNSVEKDCELYFHCAALVDFIKS